VLTNIGSLEVTAAVSTAETTTNIRTMLVSFCSARRVVTGIQ